MIVAFVLFAREFDTATFAQLSYFNIALGAIVAVATMGMGTVATRVFAHSQWTADDARRGGTLLAFMFASALLAAVIVAILPLRLTALIGPLPLGLIVFSAVIGAIPAGALAGRQAYGRLAVHALLAATLLLVLAALSVKAQDASRAVFAVALAYAGKALLDLFAFYRGERERIGRPDAASTRHVIRSSLNLAITAIINASALWLIAAAIMSKLGDVSLGQYAVGMQWYGIGAFAAASLTRVMLPRQAQAARSGHRSALLRPAIMIGIGAGVVLAVAAWLAQPVISAAYGSTVADHAWLFLAASISVAPANMVANQLIAEEREPQWLKATLAWGAVLLVCVPVALPSGVLMVLASLVLANVVLIVVGSFQIKREVASCPA